MIRFCPNEPPGAASWQPAPAITWMQKRQELTPEGSGLMVAPRRRRVLRDLRASMAGTPSLEAGPPFSSATSKASTGAARLVRAWLRPAPDARLRRLLLCRLSRARHDLQATIDCWPAMQDEQAAQAWFCKGRGK